MTQELTTIERAEQAVGFATLKPQLEALVKKSANIQDITNPAGRQECHSALMALKTQRVAIEKTGKEAREEATRYSKAVIAAEKSLVDIISPEEDRLASIRQKWDDRIAAEKAEQERIEREAQQAQQAGIAEIAAVPGRLWGASVPELETALAELQGWDMAQFDDVHLPTAQAARTDAIAAVKEARDKRQALDDEAEAVKAAQEELARQRAALEAEQTAARAAQEAADRAAAEARAEADRAAQAERDRLAEEARAEQERVAAAQREETARLEAQRKELERQNEIAAQRARQEQEDRERIEAEAQAARDAQAAQERAEAEARADEQHQTNVRQEIAAELVERGLILTSEDAARLVDAIHCRLINGLTIVY